MSSERTEVAIGCSTDADYNFLLPLTCLFWRHVVGHNPYALLVGSESEWSNDPRLNVALNAFDDCNFSRRWMGHLDGYADAQLAQNSRQHAAASQQIRPDTWIMPADADLWPLRPEPYRHHIGSKFRAVIAPYANGDHFLGKTNFLERIAAGKRAQTIPTCHVAMRAKDWRAIYHIEDTDITKAVQGTLDGWFAEYPRDDFNTWMSDQDIMTAKLCQQSWFPAGTPNYDNGPIQANGEVLFVARRGHPPVDRLCRSVPELWVEPFNASKWTDTHLPKAPYSNDNWPKLMAIIEATLPQEYWAWADKYRTEYVEAMA